MSSTFPAAQDVFLTIPTPTATATNKADASDITLSSRLQQHSDCISAIEAWLLANSAEPTGTVKMFAGSTAPTGYLLCDGTLYSTTTFATLFAVISTTYGSGSGTFAVPDLRGRAPIGVGAATSLTSARALAAAIGEETHVLATAELASHNHGQNAHTHTDSGHNHSQNAHSHTDSGHTHTDSGHTHNIFVIQNSTTPGGSFACVAFTPTNPSGAGFAQISTNAANIVANTATNVAAAAVITASTATNIAAGSGTAHNNIQPSLALNFIIKT